MKQSITLGKVTEFMGLGFLSTLKDLFTGKLEKEDFRNFLRKVVVPLASILLFIGLWHMGAKSLYNKEADFKIEKALTEQGQEAADALRACIASGDISCQPNTLPSPAQVWDSYKALLKDHNIISADKAEFIEKTATLNAERLAEGKAVLLIQDDHHLSTRLL
ncbi:hypothetical protein [Thalassobellus suaedae]|uniref:Uncharacterized protein n=1 Tax=Thalassobellus suaedae TaxID=3074124 RepID=A0ABY9XXU4_9FLAO|nr:hypothetical protein RHP51_09110 [Flavobacteriaceae bacterium HL-DH14]